MFVTKSENVIVTNLLLFCFRTHWMDIAEGSLKIQLSTLMVIHLMKVCSSIFPETFVKLKLKYHHISQGLWVQCISLFWCQGTSLFLMPMYIFVLLPMCIFVLLPRYIFVLMSMYIFDLIPRYIFVLMPRYIFVLMPRYIFDLMPWS